MAFPLASKFPYFPRFSGSLDILNNVRNREFLWPESWGTYLTNRQGRDPSSYSVLGSKFPNPYHVLENGLNCYSRTI